MILKIGTAGIVLGVIGIVIVLILMFMFTTYNGLIKLREIVNEAFATMDVYLKQRWDLIPNLVETVKGYAKHEAETLEKLVSARSEGYANKTDAEKIAINKEVQNALNQFLVVAESYPDLKANANFQELMATLRGLETDIANSRKYYNATVRGYNTKIALFPQNLIAGMFGFTPRALFEIDSNERENVKVQF